METNHGMCPVCGKTSTLRCGNCKREFYCDKTHQSQDWPRHKPVCKVWEIDHDPAIGRYLLATRDVLPGDVILSEAPLVWGPATHVVQRLCVSCGKQCGDIDVRCTKCRWPVCKSDCERLTNDKGHKLECAILARMNIIPRCEILLVIRMLILWYTKSKYWTYLTDLQSHKIFRGPGTEAYEEVLIVIQQLESLLLMLPGCKNIFPLICGLIDVNALDTVPPEGCVAIYKNASLLEHSCIPNTQHRFHLDDKGQPRITVTAATSIKRGEHLSITYTHALWCTRARQEHLFTTKYFTCKCKRCADPTEFGTYLGALKCPCKKGLVLPDDPLDLNTDWSCNICQGIVTSSEVADLMNRLDIQVMETMTSNFQANENALSDLLSRLIVLLHPGHQYCMTVNHSLMQLLPPNDPLKSKLCKHIIDTITCLDPYGTRLAIYMAVALRELAICPGEDKQALLSKAMLLLETEPPNSPGEKLFKLLQVELSL